MTHKNDLRHLFDKYLLDALRELEERAKKIDTIIENVIEKDILDDSTSECYLEFDSMERPIFYPRLGQAGLTEWQEIVKSAPKIGFVLSNEMKDNETCVYLDYGDGKVYWCNMDECANEIEKTCTQFDNLVCCHRFTFHINLHGIKFSKDGIA